MAGLNNMERWTNNNEEAARLNTLNEDKEQVYLNDQNERFYSISAKIYNRLQFVVVKPGIELNFRFVSQKVLQCYLTVPLFFCTN